MASTPAANSSSASLGVIPTPPAAFSPLATTKSAPSSSRRAGSSSRITRRPARPTTSPMKRIAVMVGILAYVEHTDDEAANPLAGVGEAAPDDVEPFEQPPPAPPARVAPVVVPRWVELVLLPLAIVGAYGLLRTAGPVLLLFVIAGLVALLLNPIVAFVQRARIPRGAAVSIVMVCLVAGLAGIGFLLANPIGDQVQRFQHAVPGYVDDANSTLADLQDWLDRKGFDVQVKREGETALQTLGDRIGGGAGSVVSFTRDALQT